MKDEGIFYQALPDLTAKPLRFPDSDGRFLPDTHLQLHAMISLWNDLESHFRKVPDVVIGGNMFMYYDPQDPAKWISPDIFVVLDRERRDRDSYKFWVERKSPDFVLDVIAPESGIRDQEDQKELYADLGIKEYFRFQPDTAREEPRLVGYRLWGQEYIELGHHPSAGPDGALRSVTLGVSLRPEGERMRLRNLATREDCLWSSELNELLPVLEKELAAAKERARRATRERRAAEQRARLATEERRAAEQRARRKQQERRAAEQRARLATEERRAAEKWARRKQQERRAAEQRARRKQQERRAAEQRARLATEECWAAEQRARRAKEERRAAEKWAAAAEERACRVDQERRAAEKWAAAMKKRANAAEAREAKLRALLAAVGS